MAQPTAIAAEALTKPGLEVVMRQSEQIFVSQHAPGNSGLSHTRPFAHDAPSRIMRADTLWVSSWVIFSLVTFLVLDLHTCQTSAYAAGNRILSQSASAAGQSAAFAAQADDPSAIYYNPAGMTQLGGVQLSLGTLLIGGDTDFTNASGQKSTGNFNGDVLWPPPSQVYLTANLKDLGLTALGDLSAGIGVLSPFGTLYDWPNDAPFSNGTTFTAFELIDIKPTLAYRLNDQLSFGVGMDIYTFFDWWGEGQGELKFISAGPPFFPLAPAGSEVEINGDDTELGFNVSLMYTPFRNDDGKPLANVGLIYRSQAVMELDGKFLVNGVAQADAKTTVVIPQVYTGAIALWPIRDRERDWKLELDVDYTGWRSFRNLDVKLSNGITIPQPQDWDSGFTVMVGTEYKWLRPGPLPHWDVALRGGYWFSETPVPEQTFNPRIPDSDSHSISVGLGLTCEGNGRFLGLFECGRGQGSKWRPKAIVLDTALQVLLYEDRSITGNNNPTVDGNYETTYYVGSLNLTAKW